MGLESSLIVITLQLTIFMQLKCSFSIVVIFNCHHLATDYPHAVKMLIFPLLSFSNVVTLQLTILMQWKYLCHYLFIFNCHHFATDHLHDYIQFTIYHLEVHFQCCEAEPITAISPKTCSLNLQLLHNTKRPTKCSGHVKMIDQHGELLHMKDLLPERVTIYFKYFLWMHCCFFFCLWKILGCTLSK